MSMIGAQIDELRRMADGQTKYRDARAVMLEAADTIEQLRDDLQRANEAVRDAEHEESRAWDRVRKAEAEADRLREMVREMQLQLNDPPTARRWTTSPVTCTSFLGLRWMG